MGHSDLDIFNVQTISTCVGHRKCTFTSSGVTHPPLNHSNSHDTGPQVGKAVEFAAVCAVVSHDSKPGGAAAEPSLRSLLTCAHLSGLLWWP